MLLLFLKKEQYQPKQPHERSYSKNPMKLNLLVCILAINKEGLI